MELEGARKSGPPQQTLAQKMGRNLTRRMIVLLVCFIGGGVLVWLGLELWL